MKHVFQIVPVLLAAAPAAAQGSDSLPKSAPDLPAAYDAKPAAIPYAKEAGLDRRAGIRVGRQVGLEPAPARSDAVVRRAPSFPVYDVDEAGRTWVLGATYKASFGPEGATYVPFLGSRAPRNFPLHLSLVSVTSGGSELPLAGSVRAARAGDVVALDRGSVLEQYVIAREGFEQRFVFDALPGRGEVVVTMDVASELAGRADESGFVFENELGHVRYGRAFALDAAGRKIGIESRLEEGRIRLVVPAEFVAQAVLPLVIDPYSGTFAVDTDIQVDWNADVAFCAAADSNAGAALVVYEYEFSATDHDVLAEKYVDQVYSGSASIDITASSWSAPRVASNELAEQFLCVAEVGTTPTRYIRGREVSANTLVMGSQFTISGTESGDKHQPDVGGDPALAAPTYYCVVWQRDYSATDTDVHARLVTSTGTLLGSTTILLADSAGTIDTMPSISKTDGRPPYATQDWNIVWQHEFSSTDDDVQGARIHWSGAITASVFTVAATTENERFPTASECLNDAGLPRQWLAVYTYGSDLRFRAFEGTVADNTMDQVSGALFGFGRPDATTDGRLWQVAYTSTFQLFPGIDVDVQAATVSNIAGAFYYSEVPLVLAGDSSQDETRPRIASTLAGPNPYRSYVAYDRYSATSDYDVLVAVYDSPVVAGGFGYCYGTDTACPCGNGGSGLAGCANSTNPLGAYLTAVGGWFVSGDTAILSASGMPPTATALYFQGTTPILSGSPFGDGLRCAGGTVIRLGTRTSVGGASTLGYPADGYLHLLGSIPATGGYRYYQCWYRNSAPFCSASTFNLTNGVALLWAP